MNTILSESDFENLIEKIQNKYNLNYDIIKNWLLACPEQVYKINNNNTLERLTTCGKINEEYVIELYNIVNNFIKLNNIYHTVVYKWLVNLLLNLEMFYIK